MNEGRETEEQFALLLGTLENQQVSEFRELSFCLLHTSPSPRDATTPKS